MRTEFGFVPRYTTDQTLDDFIRRGSASPVIGADTWRGFEHRVVSAAHRLVEV